MDRTALTRVIAVANGKGGVGKTSLCTHLGGQCAAAGLRTLLVDLDVQGNAAEDLGYGDRSDEGRSIITALASGLAPVVIEGVRPNLDVVAGGPMLHGAGGIIDALEAAHGKEAAMAQLATVLAPLAVSYDVVLLDCPPGLRKLLQIALVAAQFVIIPTKTDGSSIKGLGEIAKNFRDAHEINPGLELLGVVLFGTTPGAVHTHREARADIAAALGDVAPVMVQTVRHVEAVARRIRRQGRLAYELENLAIDAQAVRTGKATAGTAGSTSTLARDYSELAREIVPLFTSRVQELEAVA